MGRLFRRALGANGSGPAWVPGVLKKEPGWSGGGREEDAAIEDDPAEGLVGGRPVHDVDAEGEVGFAEGVADGREIQGGVAHHGEVEIGMGADGL